MKKSLLIPAVLLSFTVAACGGSPTSSGGGDDKVSKLDAHAKEVYDQINGLTGQERTDKLEELALEEGALSLYTSNIDMDSIVEGFSDTYDIDVAVYRGNSETVLQRVLQESKANYQGVDLVETNSGELDIMASEGLFYDYTSEFRDKVRPEGQQEGWTADRFNVFVVAWNKDNVKPSEVPDSLEDFTDPSWKGRVSMEIGDVDWYATMYNYLVSKGKTEAEVDEMFTAIANNAKLVKGHTTQAELLAAGEFDAGVSMYSHSTDEGEKAGQPITWHTDAPPVQPLVIRPNGAALMGNATHPAAALLFMDYLLTEGQQAIADVQRIGSVPTGDDPLAGLEVIPVDEDLMLNDGEEWSAKYEEAIKGGEATE